MNKLIQLFNITYPIVQGGMVWCSGWRLAAAVSNSGGLGLIGAGSMHPETLLQHIVKCKAATDKPFGINIPLLYPQIDALLQIVIEQEVKIVFTSAGSPKKYTTFLKSHGITVVHVVSSAAFAKKAEEAGCDAVVAEGFEAGGHNGREETTTMCLIPEVSAAVNIPVIAAGGIASGSAMFAAMALGADGVQVGSRFAVTTESSAHENFKQAVVAANEGDTILTLKELVPVRLLKNQFYHTIQALGTSENAVEKMREHLGKGRAKMGIFEGDLKEGELEIGQVSAHIKNIVSAKEVIDTMLLQYQSVKTEVSSPGRFDFNL